MSQQWSWKQAVADQILTIANDRNTLAFTLEDIYEHEPNFARRFPSNQNIRPKIRQTLQRLRDISFITFSDAGGQYQLNTAFSDIECFPASSTEFGLVVPESRQVFRTVRLRNSLLCSDMKRRYDNACQVCSLALQLAEATYAEAHHLKPIGSPHFGSDTEDNILVLCPNHHVMFDRGAILIEPETLRISHIRNAFEPRPLCISHWHRLNPGYVAYYLRKICRSS